MINKILAALFFVNAVICFFTDNMDQGTTFPVGTAILAAISSK